MKSQRGFGVIEIVELIAVAAFVGVVIAGAHHLWESFRTWAGAPAVAAKVAEYEPKLTAADKRATDAERAKNEAVAANQTLQGDVKRITGEGAECSAKVNEWRGLAERAMNAADKNEATARATLAQLNADRQRNIDRSRMPPSANATCQQILNAIDEDSSDLARKRAILFPPELAPERLRVK